MKTVKMAIIMLIGLMLLDLLLWINGRVPLTNSGYRIASNAPDIHLNGKKLMFKGTVHDRNMDLYKESDEKIQLYKAPGTPDQPPWIYVQSDTTHNYYRYSYPRVPWKI